jgi:hypothetical protein
VTRPVAVERYVPSREVKIELWAVVRSSIATTGVVVAIPHLLPGLPVFVRMAGAGVAAAAVAASLALHRRKKREQAALRERIAAARRRLNTTEAVALLEELCRASRDGKLIDAEVELGAVELQRGDLGRALELLSAADARQQVETECGANTAYWLSLTYALRGDLGASSTWREESIRRRTQARARPAATLLLDAVLACRRGDEAAAAGLIAAGWREVEQTHTAVELRPVQAVQAFALSRTGADRAVVGRHLATARTGRAGELEYLGAEWPEMAAFLHSA